MHQRVSGLTTLSLAAVASLFFAACVGGAAPEPRPMAPGAALELRGFEVARQRCASCHSIERDVSSSDPAAPPFDRLYARFPTDQLGERIRGGLMVDHPRMPLLVSLTAEDEQALEAYLASLHP